MTTWPTETVELCGGWKLGPIEYPEPFTGDRPEDIALWSPRGAFGPTGTMYAVPHTLLTIRQVADLRGLSRTDSVYALISKGQINAQKMGRDWLVPASEAVKVTRRPGRQAKGEGK
jgi:excisionase family DNA binding protein